MTFAAEYLPKGMIFSMTIDTIRRNGLSRWSKERDSPSLPDWGNTKLVFQINIISIIRRAVLAIQPF